MSADEHLSPTQFFHATNARLKPGEMIVPRAHRDHPDYQPRHPDDDGEDFGGDSGWGVENTSKQTYMSDDAGFASGYGRYTYRVQPTGPYGRDWRPYHEGKSYVSEAPLKVKGVESVDNRWDRVLP